MQAAQKNTQALLDALWYALRDAIWIGNWQARWQARRQAGWIALSTIGIHLQR